MVTAKCDLETTLNPRSASLLSHILLKVLFAEEAASFIFYAGWLQVLT